jgi:hypothetical protein
MLVGAEAAQQVVEPQVLVVLAEAALEVQVQVRERQAQQILAAAEAAAADQTVPVQQAAQALLFFRCQLQVILV